MKFDNMIILTEETNEKPRVVIFEVMDGSL